MGSSSLTGWTGGFRPPAYSPDDERIAYQGRRGYDDADQGWDVFVADAEGTGVARLTDGLAQDAEPTWSPDGTKIAFDTNQLAGDVWVMDADGPDRRNPTPTPYVGQYEPSFSPNGRKIAYAGCGPPTATPGPR